MNHRTDDLVFSFEKMRGIVVEKECDANEVFIQIAVALAFG